MQHVARFHVPGSHEEGYYLSRRSAAELLSDLVGVRISLGAVSAVEARVSEAVAPAVEDVCEHALNSPREQIPPRGYRREPPLAL